jgi:soluble lytic murein transglycosylase
MRLPTGEWMTASILSGFYRSGVSPLWALSIARQESRFRERSLSVDGALGVMQLMPKTAMAVVAGEGGALAWGLERNLGQVRHPEINSLIGGLYLKRLISSVPGHPERAIAGYNAGLHSVLSWRRLAKTDWDFFTESIPYQETRRYVREVLWNYAYLERHLKGVRTGTP